MVNRVASESITSTRPRSLWRNRDYILLLSGQTISNFGTQASQLAFPLLVLLLTHSPFQAGIISGLRLIPYIVLGLPAGAWVDRLDRKRLMLVSDLIRALALGSIPFAYFIGHLTLIQLYVTSLIEGSLYVFFSVAEASCLPHVVEKEQMSTALGQDKVSDGAASLLGPSIGGALFSFNLVLPFLADAISYAFSVISLLFIRISFQREKQPVVVQRKISTDVIEGLRWLWRQPIFCFLSLLNGGLFFSIAGMPILIITLAQQQHVSTESTGLITAASGVGMLIGSFLGPSIQKRFSLKQITIALVWAYCLVWPLYAIASTPFLIGVITAVLSMNPPIRGITNATYRYLLVPDEMQGRINSLLQLIAWCTIPLGNLVTGTLLQLQGSINTILFFGACFLVLAVITSLNPHIRHAPSWAELQRIHETANAARSIYEQSKNRDHASLPQTGLEKTTWVSFDRYLLKPVDSTTGTQEICVFPSASSLATSINRHKWAGIDRYLLKLPDVNKDTQEVSVFEAPANMPETFFNGKWTGIDRYLLKLPDVNKDTQEVSVSEAIPNVSGAFFNGKWTGIDRYLLKLSDVNKDTQEVSVFGATAKVTEPPLNGKWTGIDRYLLKLSDINKDTQEVSVFGATAKVTETFLKSK
jgi:MFS family permease